MERIIERLALASRWLTAPLYLGLALVLLTFLVQFFAEIVRLGAALASGQEVHLTLAALAEVDLVLVASLVLIVLLNGVESIAASRAGARGMPVRPGSAVSARSR